MKKLLMVGLFLSSQLCLIASSGDAFKLDSNKFCDIFIHNNNLDISLDDQFIFESSKLVKAIQFCVSSIDDINEIQKEDYSTLTSEQIFAMNYHIINLNIIRKTLMHIKNDYELSHAMHKSFDCYRSSIDSYYYQLCPSYESYLLQQCNVSLQEITHASLYAIASTILLANACVGIGFGLDLSYANYEHRIKCLILGIPLASLGAYLAHCSYESIHNPSYEFDLIANK